MSRKQMWMGTRGYEMWVAAPSINMQRGRVGFASETPLLNGGLSTERSMASHGEWAFSWSALRAEDFSKIEAIASGLYDTEDNRGLIHFVDPMAAYTNVLSQDFATPGMADVIPLVKGQEPVVTFEAMSPHGYPARSATYTIPSTLAARRVLYVPIPPGHRLVIGAHGSGAGAVRVTPYSGASAGSPTSLPWLGRDAQLTSHSFGGGAVTGVEITLTGTTGAAATINALIGQILPGVPAAIQSGRFMPGRGAGGCVFTAPPAETALSAALDLSAFTARVAEVEPWL